jgi:putative membrane protein insertion efficiency factor
MTRRRLLALVLVATILMIADLRRAPADQMTARAAVAGIHLYQATLSRVYSRAGVQCRFSPTCSHYAEACLLRFGAARGAWLAARRVLKCGPWTPAGTHDPPPTI